jgi:hypothetical protein
MAVEEAHLKLWRALTAISMWYLLVGSFWFQHWYVLWALASAALMPDSQFTCSLLPWLTFGALLSNVANDIYSAKLTFDLIRSKKIIIVPIAPDLIQTRMSNGNGSTNRY